MNGVKFLKEDEYEDRLFAEKATYDLKFSSPGLEIYYITAEAGAYLLCLPHECDGVTNVYTLLSGKLYSKHLKKEVEVGDAFSLRDITKNVCFHVLEKSVIQMITDKQIHGDIIKEHEKYTKILDDIHKKDFYTREHCVRVAKLCVLISRHFALTPAQQNNLFKAARAHDVGKISVPMEILSKPGALTTEEFLIMKEHVSEGVRIVNDIFEPEVAKIVEGHHERMDGSGYPKGLKEDQLSLEALILGVADSFDAMTSDRPYRAALSMEETIRELEELAGEKYPEEIIGCLIEIIKEEMHI